MRMYTQTVFDDSIASTVEVYSDPRYNDDLGRADGLAVQVNVTGVNSTPTLTVVLYGSNDGLSWTALETLVNASPSPPVAYFGSYGTGTGELLYAQGRIGLAISQGTARVRVLVSGRSR